MPIHYGTVKGFVYRSQQPTTKERAVPTKTCTRCGERLPLTDFNRSSDGALGRTSRCKRCLAEIRAEANAKDE